jgi:hypothetical protein
MASELERRQAAARALADPATQAQFIEATRRLADPAYMAAVNRNLQNFASVMADAEFWESYRSSIVNVMSTFASQDFWASYRRSVVATMSLFSDANYWETFREQLLASAQALSSPEMAAALQRQVVGLSKTEGMYSDAVRQALDAFARQMSDPAVAAIVRERLAATWQEQADREGADGPLPIAVFANLVFTCVLLWCLGYFVGESNRTGEDLSDANRFEVASSVMFAVSIAFGARRAVLWGAKHLGA